MPVVFIHGVNTRNTDPDYEESIATRDALLKRRVLTPLAKADERFAGLRIVDAYWGEHGVSFGWDLASLPEVSTIEHLGEDEEPPDADVLFTEAVEELSGRASQVEASAEALGGAEAETEGNVLQRAALADLSRFLEHVLTPVLLVNWRITDPARVTPEREGTVRALLAIACAEVATDANIHAALATASSDAQVMETLREKVTGQFRELLRTEFATDSPSAEEEGVEALGVEDWLDELSDRAKELFDRALGAPGRAVSVPLLQFRRDRLSRRLSLFLGDVFVYLNERGNAATPGPIISTVREGIATAPRTRANEPLIVITHSMGGNILYDLITHFDRTITIDVWVSVAGRVGQFEEMKLFRASDKSLSAPRKVTGVKPRVKYWMNVYDPADVLSFRVAPIFEEVDDDLPYLTGSSALKAHGEYFGRASFYDLVLAHLEKAIRRGL
jgi:hypothetical protein